MPNKSKSFKPFKKNKKWDKKKMTSFQQPDEMRGARTERVLGMNTGPLVESMMGARKVPKRLSAKRKSGGVSGGYAQPSGGRGMSSRGIALPPIFSR